MEKLRLLIISVVKPYPRNAGQQVRVYNKLLALRPHFHITFLTPEISRCRQETEDVLKGLVDEVTILDFISQQTPLARLWYKLRAWLYMLQTGLKTSNYILGQIELSPQRIAEYCTIEQFDLVLYEYWHTHNSTALFQAYNIPTVLDMHDVLWQSYDVQLRTSSYPWLRWLQPRFVEAYRQQEEAAWSDYDALIAISDGEAKYAQQIVPDRTVILAPMGADLDKWPYCWQPSDLPRLAFYGSMGGWLNQESVLWCVRKIMPLIWQQMPEVEFWVVGANPPSNILALQSDERIHVTRFVPNVIEVLQTMTAVLCPWQGKFGFRSRLIEVMALGVPAIVSPDAVYGMGMANEEGIFLVESNDDFAVIALELIQRKELAQEQSQKARKQVEDRFSFMATYGKLATDLYAFARRFKNQKMAHTA